MFYYNLDIFNIIISYLNFEDIIKLKQLSKYFIKNVNIIKFIKYKYNYNYDYFKNLYIDLYKYNIFLDKLIKINSNTLHLIKDKYLLYFKDKKNLYNYYNDSLKLLNNNIDYTFNYMISKIFIIDLILPIINYIYKNNSTFCLLYSENKSGKHIFDIDIIQSHYIYFEKLYYILQYNTILYNNIFSKSIYN
jgi:hypothetical protein